jgi:hypothetical protein
VKRGAVLNQFSCGGWFMLNLGGLAYYPLVNLALYVEIMGLKTSRGAVR